MRATLALLLVAILSSLFAQAIFAGGPPTPTAPTTSPTAPIPADTSDAATLETKQTRLPAQVEIRYFTNLRTGPGPVYPVVRTVDAGEHLPVFGCDAACDWYLVGRGVWVSTFVVRPHPSIPSSTTQPPEEKPADSEISAQGAVAAAADSAETEPLIEGDAGDRTRTEQAQVIPRLPGEVRVTVRTNTALYRGPGTAYRLVDTVAPGQEFSVIGRNSLGNWYVLVSGDWIPASAVAGAPDTLPIAWEPPAPPGGPELLSTRQPDIFQESTDVAAPASSKPETSQQQQTAPGNCVDINTASFEELSLIHEIDADRAAQIIQLRQVAPFASVESMTRISGIAEVRLGEIIAQGLACVR